MINLSRLVRHSKLCSLFSNADLPTTNQIPLISLYVSSSDYSIAITLQHRKSEAQLEGREHSPWEISLQFKFSNLLATSSAKFCVLLILV